MNWGNKIHIIPFIKNNTPKILEKPLVYLFVSKQAIPYNIREAGIMSFKFPSETNEYVKTPPVIIKLIKIVLIFFELNSHPFNPNFFRLFLFISTIVK